MIRPLRNEDGFTLIELLVTLAVLGMVSALLANGLSLSGQAKPERRNGDDGEQLVIVSQTVLRNRLEHLAPLVRTDVGEPLVDLVGEPRSFSFAGPPAVREGPGALLRYRLLLTSAGDLMLYSASTLDDRVDVRDPSLIGWQPARLLERVRHLDIAYFGPGPTGDEGIWQEYWRERHDPPALIRIRVGFAENDRRFWPDLVVRPAANVNTACRVQRLTGRCST